MSFDLPDACGTAFKEWEGVRDALASGRQTILLRKGGILDGAGGFSPGHRHFWIYPTRVHEAEQGLKTLPAAPRPTGGDVPIDVLISVAGLARLDRFDQVEALDDAHVWTTETLRKRFEYRAPGLRLLAVRAYVAAEPTLVPIRPEDAGCRTWVPLSRALPTVGLRPALPDDEFLRRLDGLRPFLPDLAPATLPEVG